MRGLCFCASLRPDPRAAFAKLIEFGSEWLEEWLKEASTMADDNGNATN